MSLGRNEELPLGLNAVLDINHINLCTLGEKTSVGTVPLVGSIKNGRSNFFSPVFEGLKMTLLRALNRR